ncbi:sodium:solute symporter family protein [Neisseria sp. Ec49-e6-T10]|uniref:sodium:solute symporter family protein n=1 Tax=Neisseria sp. Ec49-e6-T10 TaxID=3140744 RepID=UPI003EBD460E
MGITFFIIYLMLIVVLSLVHGKKPITKEGFLVNNRCSSASMVSSSIVASCVGASATIGVVGLAFKVGTPAFWWLGCGAIGLIILSLFVAKKVRSTNAYTLSQIIENLLGKKASYLASIIIIIAWTAILAAQLTAAAMLIEALTGLKQPFALFIGSVLITLHTLAGGQESIIKLDRIQYLIILIGLIVTLLWLVPSNPTALNTIEFEFINEEFPFTRFLYFLLILGGSYIVCPMLYGRVLSAKDEKTAQYGVLKAAIAIAFISMIIVCIGLFAKGLIAQDTPTDLVLTTIIKNIFPSWFTGLIYIILLSAVISSADSCLLTAGITLSQNIAQQHSVLFTRISIIVLMLVALLLTFTQKSILGFLLMANDIYVCSIVTPLFIYLAFSKTKDDIHATFATSGMILTGLLGLTASISANYYFAYLGIGVSILFTLLSLLPKHIKFTTINAMEKK